MRFRETRITPKTKAVPSANAFWYGPIHIVEMRDIQFYEALYLSKKLQPLETRIRQQFAEGDFSGGYYIILPSLSGSDYLDIRPARALTLHYLPDSIMIFGIARSRSDAIGLVEDMTKDCWNQRGDANLRAFFSHSEKSERKEEIH